ncbi:MAG: DsrE family protein [Pseudomonadota bacterium]
MIRTVMIGLALSACASAQLPSEFRSGDVIKDYGPVADVAVSFSPPEGQTLKAVFDVAETVETGENIHISKLARLINMHGPEGLQPRPLDLIVVVHGRALGDLIDEDTNAQRGLVSALIDNDVRFVVCGQSMAALQIDPDLFLPGVEIALSAMTAHASLSAAGYVSMPF